MPITNQAALLLFVRDAEGQPLAFRAELWRSGENAGRFWSADGSIEIRTASGPVTLLVRHGVDYDAVEMVLDLPEGPTQREVTLPRRFDARSLGWYSGENHMHVLHGRHDQPATFADGARMAAGDGLDYIQLGYAWDPTFAWLTAEELDLRSREVSSDRVTVGWNVETPKCYLGEDDGGRKGNLHCYGHGWTVGLHDISKGKEFFFTGPNFRIMQEIRRQGGITGCAHPVRFWFNNGQFVSNWASELPFDFTAGVPYAAVDILNDSPLLFFQSERLWWNLLNMGYKVAGTGNSDGNLGAEMGVGRYRTYTRITGPFSWEKLAQGVKRGACIATSGPFVLFDVDGQDPGSEFPADAKPRAATIQAWSGALPGETLVSVQLVRNGEIVRAWDLRDQPRREWSTTVELRDDEYAWYAVRVLSTCRDRHALKLWGPVLYELAVANPVYFLPRGFERPRPTPARVTLRVADEHGRPLAAEASVIDAGLEIARHAVPPSGIAAFEAPATAALDVRVPGRDVVRIEIFRDGGFLDYCRNIGTVCPSFYSPETWAELRARLGRVTLQAVVRGRQS